MLEQHGIETLEGGEIRESEETGKDGGGDKGKKIMVVTIEIDFLPQSEL